MFPMSSVGVCCALCPPWAVSIFCETEAMTSARVSAAQSQAKLQQSTECLLQRNCRAASTSPRLLLRSQDAVRVSFIACFGQAVADDRYRCSSCSSSSSSSYPQRLGTIFEAKDRSSRLKESSVLFMPAYTRPRSAGTTKRPGLLQSPDWSWRLRGLRRLRKQLLLCPPPE